MKTLTTQIGRFFREEDGVTAIEYGLIASIMAIVIISAWGTIATGLTKVAGTISAKLL